LLDYARLALSYGEPDAISNAIGYAKFYSRSHDAVIQLTRSDRTASASFRPWHPGSSGTSASSSQPLEPLLTAQEERVLLARVQLAVAIRG